MVFCSKLPADLLPGVEWSAVHQVLYAGLNLLENSIVLKVAENFVNEFNDDCHILFNKTS